MVSVSEASAREVRNTGVDGVVEEAGHFRVYLGAAAGVGKKALQPAPE
jgi:K+-sensing histidine kinase KdpD